MVDVLNLDIQSRIDDDIVLIAILEVKLWHDLVLGLLLQVLFAHCHHKHAFVLAFIETLLLLEILEINIFLLDSL
jgi:hypothetical protein